MLQVVIEQGFGRREPDRIVFDTADGQVEDQELDSVNLLVERDLLPAFLRVGALVMTLKYRAKKAAKSASREDPPWLFERWFEVTEMFDPHQIVPVKVKESTGTRMFFMGLINEIGMKALNLSRTNMGSVLQLLQ